MKKVKLLLYIFLPLFCISLINAQSAQSNTKSIPQKVIDQIEEGKSFSKYDIFTSNPTKKSDEKINAIIDKYSILVPQNNSLSRLISERKNRIEITLTDYAGKRYDLLLYQVDNFAPDFSIKTSDPRSNIIKHTAVHYRGIIANNNHSMVAISFFDNEVMGIVADGRTQLVLGKLKGNTMEHILYKERDMKATSNFTCGTTSGNSVTYSKDDLTFSSTQKSMNHNCVSVYIEVDNDVFTNIGANTANFITGLFNQSAALFANDDIFLVMSEMFIWETAHDYNGGCSFELLEDFQNATNAINGDIGHLITMNDGLRGRAAGFNALCNNDVDERLCISGIQNAFNNIPTYSWNVNVLSHEMGHLLGSRHTHACVWNGNNTAIDGCGGCQEEPNPPPAMACGPTGIDCMFCAAPPIPAAGGTVMSYCHNNPVGMNFALGFGPQPTAVILNNINNANCLTQCPHECEQDLTLTGTETGLEEYAAQNTITSTQTITPTGDVTYEAGDLIILTPGFVAQTGSDFVAINEDCTANFGENMASNSRTDQQFSDIHTRMLDSDISLENTPNRSLMVSPNPFQNATNITYTLDEPGLVILRFLSASGTVLQVIQNQETSAGSHQLQFDSSEIPSGVYYLSLQTSKYRETQKLLIIK